jgi:hypothetical protein
MNKDFSSDFKDYERDQLLLLLKLYLDEAYFVEVAEVSLNGYFDSLLVSETSDLFHLLNEMQQRSY